MESDAERNQMIPFLSIGSREFERDLNALKLVMNQLEKGLILRMHIDSANEHKWQLDGGFMMYL
jgi:hypothetical protein